MKCARSLLFSERAIRRSRRVTRIPSGRDFLLDRSPLISRRDIFCLSSNNCLSNESSSENHFPKSECAKINVVLREVQMVRCGMGSVLHLVLYGLRMDISSERKAVRA